MTAEIKPETTKASIFEGVRDFMLPPNTARPYRILTCISKAGEIALVLGGTISGMVTKNWTLTTEGAMSLIPLSFNIGLDGSVERRNASKDRLSKKGR